MENNFFYFIFISYIIGSIPFAYILTKLYGYGDIRKIGSGNIGEITKSIQDLYFSIVIDNKKIQKKSNYSSWLTSFKI